MINLENWRADVKALDNVKIGKTEGSFHVYADGTNGSDNNDGLTSSTPKKTIQAAADVIPFRIRHNVTLHLTGVFSEQVTDICKSLDKSILFVVDGGAEVTTVAGPYTADISSTSSIGLALAGWTPDEYCGYIVEITSGPRIGEFRTIVEHSATTITPNQNFGGDPGACTFRIVKPATTIESSTIFGFLRFACTGAGQLQIQRLTVQGTKCGISIQEGPATTYIASIVSLSTGSSIGGLSVEVPNATLVVLNNFIYDPDAFTPDVTLWCAGFGQVAGDASNYMTVKNTCFASTGAYVKSIFMSGCRLYGFYASRFISILMESCTPKELNGLMFGDYSAYGYCVTKISASPAAGISGGSGLLAKNSIVGIAENVVIEDNDSHGIEAINSRIDLQGDVKGTGNVGAGVCYSLGSIVSVESGNAPTITGGVTPGDLSFDGANEQTTWANLETVGCIIESTTDLLLAKKI